VNAHVRRTVLVSGAGIAGPMLAYHLARAGVAVTLVEKAAELRSSGSPVDVRGRALRVVQAMGLNDRLRDASTSVDSMAFVDRFGKPVGKVSMRTLSGFGPEDSIELPRGALARALFEAAAPLIEVKRHDTIARLHQDSDGVDVDFERGDSRRFDLVVGADGLHSNVRRLAFGPERSFVHPSGVYVATLPIDHVVSARRVVTMSNAPGRSLTIHPSRERPVAALIFWSEPPAVDVRDLASARDLLRSLYGGDGWLAPDVLHHLDDPEFWFDSVSHVRIEQWSHGRVVLLGDAASCASLFGGGSSLAIEGADCLARALAKHPINLAAALGTYEREHRRRAAAGTSGMRRMAMMLVPRTAGGLWLRNAAVKTLSLVSRAPSGS
jgi:2-polyprenyl-6-methoxyphenol hydroxylase-like FAD-dependent oxidoreductase